jgi:hypothetical protein
MFQAVCERGSNDALATFGFAKEARDMAWFKKMLAAKLKKPQEKMAIDWGSVGQFAKRMMIGDPKQFLSQLSKGELHKPGGMWRESLKPQGALDALMMYGFPAFSMYQAMKAPPEQRGSAIGGTLGGAVGGMLGMPLGMVGNTIGSNLVGRLGQSVGHSFDSSPHRSPAMYYRRSGNAAVPVSQPGPRLSEQMSTVTGRPTKL